MLAVVSSLGGGKGKAVDKAAQKAKVWYASSTAVMASTDAMEGCHHAHEAYSYR